MNVWNYLSSLQIKLSEEVLLLLLASAWVLLRSLGIIAKRVEKGKPVRIKVLGREFLEVTESSNSEVRHIGKNT